MESRRSLGIRLFAVVPICVTLFLLAHAQGGHTASKQISKHYPSDPILRLETGMHTAMVNRIDVDRGQRFLVSGSDDKTVRIWDLQSGRLYRTLRVPLGKGNLGKAYAVAISPDGATVAVGGWTGDNRWGGHILYTYHRASGAMKPRVSGLPNVINHLTFSPDGRYLAAALGGSNGVRVYETKSYKLVGEDRSYGDRSSWADFDASGRLVTTCYDGYLRLYSPTFRLIRKKRVPGGKEKPFSAAFSPDGRRIAVAYRDSTRVDVVSANTLELLFSADTKDATKGNLNSVAWSEDGRYLYGAGTYDVSGWNPIRRWDKGGQGKFVEFKVATDTVMDHKPLKNGRLAFGSGDPVVAVLDARGKPIWKQRGDIADFRNQRGKNAIRLSESGDTVRFGYEVWGKRPARFSIKEWRLDLDPPEDARLSRPITEAPGLKITDWERKYTPKLNGKALALKKYEKSFSLAIAPDGKRFLLGTAWNLRLFDRNGKELWRVAAPEVAWAVNISGDGKRAVAAYGDGTIRWYRMKDGRELLAFFPHRDGKRWIVWTPKGFYQASAGAEDLIGWHLNHGIDQAPDFYGASRFRKQFYRPDVVARVIDTLDVDTALRLADKERGRTTVTRNLRDILPPQIVILAPSSGTKTKSKQLVLTYQASSRAGPITEIKARVNGRPARVLSHFPHSKDAKHTMVGQITIEVPTRDATVSLIAKNQHGSSEPATFFSSWAGAKDWYKPHLYVLAIGVNNYGLQYAARDAEDFVQAIKVQRGGLYKEITTRLLASTKRNATKDDILDGLEWLDRQTTSRDVAMVFIAGHGFKGPQGNYHFLPQEGDPTRARRTCIRDRDIEEFLSTIAGKTVLFLDTCHSGSILRGVRAAAQQADVDKFANELADAGTGVIVFSSSTGKQFSVEKKQWNNGAFTEALLEGIRGMADLHKDWYISIAELEVYLSERVKALTQGKQKPMTAKPKTIEDFKIIRVSRSDRRG